MKVVIIGVAGGSGSGKTTLSNSLLTLLGSDQCQFLTQDHYYFDQSSRFKGDGENVNFDHPSALDFDLLSSHLIEIKRGNTVDIPIYDFVTHKRLEQTNLFLPKPYVIVDGTLLLHPPHVRSCLDYKIYVETNEQNRFQRRLDRDVRERGRTPEGVLKQFERQVKPMHDEFVEPSKRFADLIVNSDHPFGSELSKILSIIKNL